MSCSTVIIAVVCRIINNGNILMEKPFVAILMGSDSDLPVMEASFEILRKFEIPFEVKVTSAHRTPLKRRTTLLQMPMIVAAPHLFAQLEWQLIWLERSQLQH